VQENSVPVSTAQGGMLLVSCASQLSASGVLGPCNAWVGTAAATAHTFKHRQQVACAGSGPLAALISSKHMLFHVTLQLIIITKLHSAARAAANELAAAAARLTTRLAAAAVSPALRQPARVLVARTC
jgi:hypothetical protein